MDDEIPEGLKTAIKILAFIVTAVLTVWWFLFLWNRLSLFFTIIILLLTIWIPYAVSYWLGVLVLTPLAVALGLIKGKKQ